MWEPTSITSMWAIQGPHATVSRPGHGLAMMVSLAQTNPKERSGSGWTRAATRTVSSQALAAWTYRLPGLGTSPGLP